MTNEKNIYFFILGRNPTLGIAEIYRWLKPDINEIIGVSERVFSVDLKTKIKNPEELMERLYGTVKIAELVSETPASFNQEEINSPEGLFPDRQKLVFGLSFYDFNSKNKNFNNWLKNKNKIALAIKRKLGQTGKKADFLKVQEETATLSILKNKLLTDGADIVFVVGPKGVFIARTIAVQDIFDYQKRNYNRPKRPLKSGIMPTKLARTMVCLSDANEKDIVLDPFCGSGTIIEELVLLGFKNIIGSDFDSKAINNARENLNWLFGQYPKLKKESSFPKLIRGNIEKMEKYANPNSIDLIITEPYLGPILNKKPALGKIEDIADDLSELYLSFFKSAFRALKPSGKIVIVFPVFPLKNSLFFLEITNEIKEIGFEAEKILPDWFKRFKTIEITDRNSVLVRKEGQIIIRELFIFAKKTGGFSD